MTKTPEMTPEHKQESALKVFGFVSEQARRNLIIFIIVMLICSNVFFIYQNIILNNKIHNLNKNHNEMMLDLSKQITDEVRKQIQPTHKRVLQTTEKLDDLADELRKDL